MLDSSCRLQVSGVRIDRAETSYETTPKWHGFLMTKLAATMAWIKQRTAEYQSVEPLELRLTNDDFRLTNGGCRFALLF